MPMANASVKVLFLFFYVAYHSGFAFKVYNKNKQKEQNMI